MTDKITILAQQAREWVTSEAGIRVQKEAAQRSMEVMNTLHKDQQVDPKALLEPITL